MTTPVSSADSGLAAEVSALHFPATQVTWQVAATLDGKPLNGLVEFSTVADLDFPWTTPPVRFEGPAVTEVIGGVMIPVTLPDSQHALSSPFTYTVTVKPDADTAYVFATSAITGTMVDVSALGL